MWPPLPWRPRPHGSHLTNGTPQADAVLEMAGVFDVRWKAGSTLLAVATADGKAAVCQADAGALDPLRLVCDTQCTAGSPPCMCTSVDWVSDTCLVACDQAGCGHLLHLAEVRATRLRYCTAHPLTRGGGPSGRRG